MNICEVWLVLKEVKALLPVASLWASLDYKSVANWPIMVSRILLLTKLISEINPEIRFQESSLLGKDTSYDINYIFIFPFFQHVVSEHKRDPYSCPTCQQGFKNFSLLNKHIR